MLIYALDIGGSSIKHATVDVNTVGEHIVSRFPSITLPSGEFADLLPLVLGSVHSALECSDVMIQAIGISTTGSVDAMGTVVSAGFFNGYKNVSWSSIIKERFPQIQRVTTINDGRASAWAEYCSNSTPVRSHIHAVVGTGVGGGIVHNGELVLGDSGQAGYIGHIKITPNSTPLCSCGSEGCVETLAAAPAIVRHFNANSQLSIDPGNTALESVTKRAQAGDNAALDAFRTSGNWLGLALGNAMNVLNPTVVTVGGGVLLASESIYSNGDGGPYLDAVSAGIARAAHRRVTASATLRAARVGNDGGIIGAARLAAFPN
jgi:glucokinase